MERVTFDRPLKADETSALQDFMKLHPEINNLQVALNFQGITDKAKIPYGTVALFERSVQIPSSLLPENISHVNACFLITSGFSELAFLRKTDLEERTSKFHSNLGKGPALTDINFKHVLPKTLGYDVHSWSPFLGKGHVSVIADPRTPEDRQQFLLNVRIPRLPFVDQLFGAAFTETEVPTAEILATHPVTKIARQVAIRNACKVAHEFASAMGIELYHKRPNIHEKKSVILPVPVALSMNPGPIIDAINGGVKIASGLVGWGNNASGTTQGVYTVGTNHSVIISTKQTRILLPFDAPKTGLKNAIGKEIGKTFLEERVFWGANDKKTLHPRLQKSTNWDKIEDFIVKALETKVIRSKPKMLFLHK